MKHLLTLAAAVVLAGASSAVAMAEDPDPHHCDPTPLHPCDPDPEHCDPNLHPCHTAVTLASFTASNGVLRWRTAQETNLLGFNVYRLTSSGRSKVNVHLIPAVGSLRGHRYVFRYATSASVRGAHTARWLLQALNADGSRTTLGYVNGR